MTTVQKKRPSSIGEKLVGWSIASLGFLAVAYLAWRRLPTALWHWANEAWWHWFVAIVTFPLLLFTPIFVLVGARHLIAVAGTSTRSTLRWETVSYLGALGMFVLILWAFTPMPAWWASWLWWLWTAAVVSSAIISAGGRMLSTVYQVDAPKVRETYSAEWKFNHRDVSAPPALGIAMSGGGLRSAAFNLGVLQALHDNGLLREVDVMSAVSGGSYTMSWYLLQPFYAAKAAQGEHRNFRLDALIDEMFRADGAFQTYLCRNPRVLRWWPEIAIAVLFDMTWFQPIRAFAAAAGDAGLYNKSGVVRDEYRTNLQRLFQGLPSPGKNEIANKIDELTDTELELDHSNFSEVMPISYRELAEFVERNRLPYFIFNATVLVQRAYRRMLWPTAFEFTAHDLGSDVCGYRTWEDLREWEVSDHIAEGMSVAQWEDHLLNDPDRQKRGERRWVFMVNLASAISGAAIGLSYFNPKKPTRKLATWTPFVSNLDLGYLFYRELWRERGTLYVSDGGHCENLGAYALIKRQCERIIIVDAEHEAVSRYVFAGYTKLKQQLAEEMHLALAVPEIDAYLQSGKGTSTPPGPSAPVMTGEVKPISAGVGARAMSVIYIKLGLDRKRLDSYPGHVAAYAGKNSHFPQDPTSNQSFTSEQFKAYRDLGCHIANNLDQIIGTMT